MLWTRDRRRDQDPKSLSVSEGHTNADALGEGVDGHHPDDHQRSASVGSAEDAESDLSPMAEHTPAEDDEPGPEERAGSRS